MLVVGVIFPRALDAMQDIDDTTIDCSSMLGKKHWLDVKKGVVTGVHILGWLQITAPRICMSH